MLEADHALAVHRVPDSLEIWLNGEQTTAVRDTMDREGVIGLQHHGEDGKVYRFRNLRVQRVE